MEGLFKFVIFELIRQLSLVLQSRARYCYPAPDGLVFSLLQFFDCRLFEATGVADMNFPPGSAVSRFVGVICCKSEVMLPGPLPGSAGG